MKRGTPDHPKVKDLASRLNINEAWAVGILELLWHFTAKFAPQGDIGKHSDQVIARGVKWQRPTGEKAVTPECKLSEALVAAKWLDTCDCHRLVVHDWKDHADEAVRKYLSRHSLDFVHTQSALALASSQQPLPEPLPAAAFAAPKPPPAALPLSQIIPFAAAACAAAAPTQRAQAEKALLSRADDIRNAHNPEGLALTILKDFGISPPPRKKTRPESRGDDYDELVAEIARQRRIGA